MTRPTDYSSLQKGLHWIIAAIVAVMIPMGLYMVQRYVATSFDAVTVKIYEVHKSLGFVALWLVLWRLAIRYRRDVPPPPAAIPLWQRRAASAVHAGLYLLLLLVPVLGWLGVSAEATGSLLGGFDLPRILPRDDDLGWRILWWHGWLAITLGLLALAHVGGALRHLLVLRDGVFQRMWPSRRRP